MFWGRGPLSFAPRGLVDQAPAKRGGAPLCRHNPPRQRARAGRGRRRPRAHERRPEQGSGTEGTGAMGARVSASDSAA